MGVINAPTCRIFTAERWHHLDVPETLAWRLAPGGAVRLIQVAGKTRDILYLIGD